MEHAAQQAVCARVYNGVVVVVGVDYGGQSALEGNAKAVSDAIEARSVYVLKKAISVDRKRKASSVIWKEQETSVRHYLLRRRVGLILF